MEKFPKSSKLDHVCYDIRGPVHKKPCNWKKKATKSSSSISAIRLRLAFEAPDEILVDVIRNLPTS